jgi:hypothetical protein
MATLTPVPEAELEEAENYADSFAEFLAEEKSGAIFAGLDQSDAGQWANDKARRVFPGVEEAYALIEQDRQFRAAVEQLTYNATQYNASTDPGPLSDDIPY